MADRAQSDRPRRRHERQSLSCTECTRRKLRCSKTIPCSACVERGRGHLCHRRDSSKRPSPFARPAPAPDSPATLPAATTVPSAIVAGGHVDISTARAQAIRPNLSDLLGWRLVDGVSEDFAVTLEFLTLGRHSIFQLADDSLASPGSELPTLPGTAEFDPVVTQAQATSLFEFHELHLVWTHNVVHLPTFRLQVEGLFTQRPPPDRCWSALYYVMLSHSLYHTDPGILIEMGISGSISLARKTHRMCIDALYAAGFMENHSLPAVQAICLLIYVGHNLGQSDLVSVLLASGIRIAQCLGMHRLGTVKPLLPEVQNDPSALVPYVLDHEVKCRAWWFLIRQDWLQIPFLNTYTIHPSQFNTPMPKNCLDDFTSMVRDGEIAEQDQAVHTQCSYTGVLNKISVLIWKTQDQMCTVGHPNKTQDGLRRLYEEVLLADADLRRIVQEMPIFFRDNSVLEATSSPTTVQQKKVLQLSNAHKFFTLHRHFQVISFKDPWYAYTKVSCLNVARRGLQAILSLPLNESSWIARNLWTVNTHMVTAAVWIMFEQLFTTEDSEGMFERAEMLDLVRRTSTRLQEVQDRSQIAARGARLLEFLLDLENAVAEGQRKRLEITDVIAYVQQGNESLPIRDESYASGIPSNTNWMSQGATAWEVFIDAMGDDGDLNTLN